MHSGSKKWASESMCIRNSTCLQCWASSVYGNRQPLLNTNHLCPQILDLGSPTSNVRRCWCQSAQAVYSQMQVTNEQKFRIQFWLQEDPQGAKTHSPGLRQQLQLVMLVISSVNSAWNAPFSSQLWVKSSPFQRRGGAYICSTCDCSD